MRITSANAAFLMLGPIAFFVLFFLAPLALLTAESFSRPGGGATLSNYISVLGDAYYWGALLNTLVISFWVTGVCFLLGYPLAYFTVFHVHRAWVRRLIYVLLITPLFTSNIVRAFGWIVILGRRGIVNSSLLAVGLIETRSTSSTVSSASSSGCRTSCCRSWRFPSAACCRPSTAR